MHCRHHLTCNTLWDYLSRSEGVRTEFMNEIQSRILSIYKNVAKVCDKNGLRYFAINGTCLGAVRHGGFIPWDDDMDLAMPIEDLMVFLEIAPSSLPDNLELHYFGTVPSYAHIFIKVIDATTTFIEPTEISYPQRYKGVWLDITPLSSYPDSHHQQLVFSRKNKLYSRHTAASKFSITEMTTLKSKIMWILQQPKVATLRADPLESWFYFLMGFPVKEPFSHAALWSPENPSRMIIPAKCFAKCIEMPFEDVMMHVPVGYDEYLSLQYRDYMKLPPLDKRQTHSKKGFVDLQHSYKLYQTGELSLPVEISC